MKMATCRATTASCQARMARYGEAPNEERGNEPDDRTLLAIRIFRMALRRMDITCAQWQRTLAP